ncbi:MAG: tetratricopeptide repeat protein [Spirochaetes bacterium]|nr:MAG: tetratricopeptide repeat protein [Spirochaetota bacterium]
MKLIKFMFFLAFFTGIAGSVIYHREVYRYSLRVYYERVKKEGLEDSLKKAKAMYSRDEYAKLKPYLSDLMTLYPGNREIVRLLGLTRIELGDRIEGARLIVSSMKEDEDLSTMQSVLEILYEEKEYPDLIDVFSRHEPRERYPKFIYGMSFYHLHRWEDAIPRLVAARDAGQDGFELHFALGTSYENAGKIENAVASFEAAFALEPHRADARQALVRAYRKAKKYDKAEKLGRTAP